jgi:hypothetical protein
MRRDFAAFCLQRVANLASGNLRRAERLTIVVRRPYVDERRGGLRFL